MSDRILGTFRIDREVWQSFKSKAEENGSNASKLLNEWVSKYLDGELDERIDKAELSIDNNLDGELDERIDKALAPLLKRLDELETQLGESAA